MAANVQPIFGLTPVVGMGQVTAANPNRDGTGALVVLFTAGVNGARVDYVVVKAIVTTTAGMIRIYISDGVNIRLWDELSVAAIVPSGTVQAFRGVVQLGFQLPVGYSIQASTENAEAANCFVHGSEY